MSVLVLDVVGLGIDGDQAEFVGPVLVVDFQRYHALGLEVPGHTAGFTKVAAAPVEGGADFGSGPVAIGGQRLEEDGAAAGTVSLVSDFREVLHPLALAGGPADSTGDAVQRHVVGLGLVHRETETEVHVRVAASAVADSQDDVAGKLGEKRTPLGVIGALLPLDGGPFRVT